MTIYVPSGISSQLIFAPETVYGTAPSLAAARALEFNSETMELKKTVVQGKGLRAGGLHNRGSRRKLTNYAVTGGITLDLPAQYINSLLKWMTGSKGSSAANLAQDGVTGAYSATHAPGSLVGNSMCFQKSVPSVDGTVANPFTYVGCKPVDWTISVASGALAQLAINLDGRNELAGAGNGDPLNASVPTLGTFTEAATNDVFHFREATLYTGGTLSTSAGVTTLSSPVIAGNVKSAEVKYAFHLDTERYFLGSNGFKAEQIENDQRDISGQFVVEWLNSEARYNAFAADTPTSLELSFVGPSIGSGSDHSSLVILVPQVYLEGESPKVGGPAVVTQTCPFTGLDNMVDNPIQITYWTIDTTD